MRFKYAWLIWTLAAILTVVGIGFAFLNCWAIADLGLDRTPCERLSANVWGYSLLGLPVCAIIFIVLAVRAKISLKHQDGKNN